MSRILTVSDQQDVLQRWSEALRVAGHVCTSSTPAALRAGEKIDAALCLYDLGPRGGMDLRPLTEAVRALPATTFVAMTAHPEAQEGLLLLRSGVRGYCNRLVSAQVLSALLSTVEAGEIWAGRQVTDFLLQASLGRESSSFAGGGALMQGLTARETQIAAQVAAGLSNKVIAADSGISERTVKAHLNSIFRKTGVRNRVQLALAVSQAESASPWRSNG